MRRRPSFTRRLFRPYWLCTEQNTKGSCPETSPLVPNPTPGSWSYVPLKIHWKIAVLNGLSVDIHKQFIAHIVGSIVLYSISNNLCETGNSQTCCAVLLYKSFPVLVHLLLFALYAPRLTLPKTKQFSWDDLLQTNGLWLSWTFCSTLCQTVKAGWESSHWDASLHSLRRYRNAASKLWPPAWEFPSNSTGNDGIYDMYEFNFIDSIISIDSKPTINRIPNTKDHSN